MQKKKKYETNREIKRFAKFVELLKLELAFTVNARKLFVFIETRDRTAREISSI